LFQSLFNIKWPECFILNFLRVRSCTCRYQASFMHNMRCALKIQRKKCKTRVSSLQCVHLFPLHAVIWCTRHVSLSLSLSLSLLDNSNIYRPSVPLSSFATIWFLIMNRGTWLRFSLSHDFQPKFNERHLHALHSRWCIYHASRIVDAIARRHTSGRLLLQITSCRLHYLLSRRSWLNSNFLHSTSRALRLWYQLRWRCECDKQISLHVNVERRSM